MSSATAPGRAFAGLGALLLLFAAPIPSFAAEAGDPVPGVGLPPGARQFPGDPPPSVAAAPRAAGRVVVDGSLEEWDASRPLLLEDGSRDPRPGSPQAWKGKEDASARILVGWDDERLCFAGRVQDDALVVNPGALFLGDCIEVFLRVPDPRGSGDHQVILAPMAQEVRWVLARHRGKAGLTDGGFDGVEVAGREVRDEQGVYRGYTFEAAIPLSNFPGLEPAGGSLGLNLALVDADGAPGQKNYLLWAGSVLPAWDASALGTLRFEGTAGSPGSAQYAAPPAGEGGGPGLGDWKVPGAIVLGALVLLALLHLARRPLQRLGDLPGRRKIALAAAIALLIAGARVVPGFVRWRREGDAVARLEESRELLLRLAADADKARVLAPRRPGESDSALVALVAGGRALPRPEFKATPLPAVAVAPRQTRGGGVPVRDTRIPLAGLGRVAFRLPELPDAASLTAVLEWRPPAPGRPRPPAGTVVGRIAAIGADGIASVLEVRLGREVDEGGPLEGDAHAAADAKVAWTEDEGAAHADEVAWRIAGAPRRLEEIVAEQVASDGMLTIRGITVHPADGSAPRPAPLGRVTRDGVPTTAWNGAPAGESLRVGPRAGKGLVPIDAEGDEVFVVCGAPAGFPPEKAGRPAASLALVLEDGSRPPPVKLVLGEDLDAERLAGLDHPEGFRRAVAFRWPGASGETLHRDVVALPVPGAGGARVLALEVESLDPEIEFVVDAVTVVRRLARPPPTGLSALQRQGDGYQVAPAAAAALEGLAVTHYRGGRAAATTMPEGLRDRVLGTEAPPELPPESSGLPEGVYARAVGGRAFLARQARLPYGDADEALEVAVPAPDARDLEMPVAAATALLLLLAIPLVLASALDALERLPHLRWKLVGAFGIAAVLPLVGLTLVLARHFEDQVDRGVERELRAHADAASRALTARRDEARRLAEECVRDEALRRALAVPEEGARAAQVDAVVRSLAARTPGARVALEVVPAGGAPAGRLTFPLGETPAPFQELWEPAVGLDYRWSRLVATGIARARVPEAGLRAVVEIPVDGRVLEGLRRAGGDRAHLLLFSPTGHPVAGTADAAPGSGPAAAAARRAVADDLRRAPGEPVLSALDLGGLPHSVAYDLVRSSDGRTAGLLATALPRQPHLAATLGTRDLILLLGSIAFVLAVVVADLVTRRVAGPVADLARVARRVGDGDLRVRADEEGRDEIASLAGAFNRMTEQLEGRIGELSRLNASLAIFAGTLDRARALELTLAAFRDASRASCVLVVLADREAGGPELAAGVRGDEAVPPRRLAAAGFLALAAKPGAARAVPTPDATPEAASSPPEERALLAGAASATVLPFAAGRGRTEGAVVLVGGDGASLDFLAGLAHQAGLALENARLYRLAVEDPSSGLYAASYFKRRLQEEIDRSTVAGRPTSVLLLGLEGLESVYSKLGPDAGNAVLRAVVDRIRTQVRRMHLLARAGRDAVAVLLPETPRSAAEETAAFVRAAVEDTPFPAGASGREVRIVVTVAAASAPDDAASAEFLENEAIRALERARAARRGSPAAAAAAPPALPGVDPAEAGTLAFRSAKSLLLLDAVNRIAASDVPVLVLGETGAGKEVVADLLHAKSRRAAGPLVKVNCAALPAPLLEAELFGYERGAFTGAERRHSGRFEQAHGGTLFLDEVGDMPPELQVKLLRVLQDRRVERLGGAGPVDVDVRVVAATNRDLADMVDAGRFREDLYFRLNVLSVVVPPLRARREDIPPLAARFLEQAVARHGTGPTAFSPEALDFLFRHPFPGNVRELRNMVERAVVSARGAQVTPRDLSFGDERAGLRLGRPAPAADEAPTVRPGFRDAGRGAAPAPSDLPERAARLLALLRTRGTLTNREWCDAERVSARTGLRDFETLLEHGLATRSGKRRSASYRPR